MNFFEQKLLIYDSNNKLKHYETVIHHYYFPINTKFM